MLVAGGIVVAVVAVMSGTSGFGFGLVATPLLLLSGFSIPFVVTVNLLITIATRVTVAVRLWRSVEPRRVALLVAGAVPGLYAGARILGSVDARTVKLAVGLLVMGAAAAAGLAYGERRRRAPLATVPGANVVAGFLGGILGTTTSLIGVPPALLLARSRLVASRFFADMAVYFVATGAIGLAVLGLDGDFDGDAARAFLFWLPGVLLGNVIGTTVGLRAPERTFRLLTLTVAFAAGALTVATA